MLGFFNSCGILFNIIEYEHSMFSFNESVLFYHHHKMEQFVASVNALPTQGNWMMLRRPFLPTLSLENFWRKLFEVFLVVFRNWATK